MRTEVIEEQYVERQLSLEDMQTQVRSDWQSILTDDSWTINETEAQEILGLAKGDLGVAVQAMKSVASDIRKRNFKLTDFMPDELINLVHKELADLLGRTTEHMNVQPAQEKTYPKADHSRQGNLSRQEQTDGLIEAYKARVCSDDPLTVDEVQSLLEITPKIGIVLQSFNLCQHFMQKQRWHASHEEIMDNLRASIEKELAKAKAARESRQAKQEKA